ncbi:MAG: hypothetical protein JXA58_02940 [Dehalococcoidia bacterium]|nr:hypothetical protein [Dehalococcoidia bacterium]
MKMNRADIGMLALSLVLFFALSGCSGTPVPPPAQDGGPTVAPQPENPSAMNTGEPDITPYAGPEEAQSSPPVSDDVPDVGPSSGPYAVRSGDGVDLVYLETTNACACMAEVGDVVESAVTAHFQDELRSGELRFFMLFSNAPGNMDVVQLLNAQPFDLFIGEYRDGQSVLRPDYGIWSLTGDNEAIEEYVRNLVLESLEGQR